MTTVGRTGPDPADVGDGWVQAVLAEALLDGPAGRATAAEPAPEVEPEPVPVVDPGVEVEDQNLALATELGFFESLASPPLQAGGAATPVVVPEPVVVEPEPEPKPKPASEALAPCPPAPPGSAPRVPGDRRGVLAVATVAAVVVAAGTFFLLRDAGMPSAPSPQPAAPPVADAEEKGVAVGVGASEPGFRSIYWMDCATVSTLWVEVDESVGAVDSVEIVGTDSAGTAFRRDLEATGNGYTVAIGPLGADGDLTYVLEATDEDGEVTRSTEQRERWNGGCT